MKPRHIKTLIYLDGCDAKETREVKDALGFLDGQTTNPTLFSKNPEVAERLSQGSRYTNEELIERYKQEIEKIDSVIGGGSVSVEVYSDSKSRVEDLVEQGKRFTQWSKSIHVKLPATKIGLLAMKELLDEGIRINITLCFSQSQAAAVYALSKGYENVYISPFIGRLDGIGEDGFDLIKNIHAMYQKGDGHVSILGASIRDLKALQKCLFWGIDIITAPKSVLLEWKDTNFEIPSTLEVNNSDLKDIKYRNLSLNGTLDSYDLSHELTEKGQEKFAEDWNALVQ
jgi:transaldolase